MKTEQQLKDQCTPEFIKWMCGLAEGFDYTIDEDDELVYFKDLSWYKEELIADLYIPEIVLLFSTLIHRAVEGWNKLSLEKRLYYYICVDYVEIIVQNIKDAEYPHYVFTDYQPQSLTPAEFAMLDCLIYLRRKVNERSQRFLL